LGLRPPARPRRRLIWKYTAVFVALVAAAIVSVGLTELYFSYQDSKKAVGRIERERASSAAASIQQRMDDILRELHDVAQPAGSGARTEDFYTLLKRDELVGRLTYLDSAGKEQVRVSLVDPDRIHSGIDFSRTPAFFRARSDGSYFGRVYFYRGSQPRMSISVAERKPGRGVIVADVDLQSVREVIDRAGIGTAGYAYAVDRQGELFAHSDLNLVLAHKSFRSLPQVRAALREPAAHRTDAVTTGRNEAGTEVLSAFRTIPRLGWRVFVEEPLSEAFAPLKSAIWRTAILLVAFLLVAIVTSVLLVRRLARPIESIQAAAAKIGSGALDERIDATRRDELGALAEEFNRMAERLQESYAGLEQKVEERTQELAEKSRELEVASGHKSEFLANMSHELRTPLNAIIGFTQVLQQKLFGEVNDKQAEYLDDIHGSADHLLELINDILDLSKVEAGQVELERTEFSLREALERGVVMLRERASKSGVRLTLEPDPEVELVTADERRIRQVVFNLLSNAVKFTPQGGSVVVVSAQENGEVLVRVTDTGPGIAPEDQERIFEEFQQTETGAEEREGTGLGLALSKRLIELHGGRIWVESKPGEGSTFTFTLPVEAKP
jgi:signal transduction histidine kinase